MNRMKISRNKLIKFFLLSMMVLLFGISNAPKVQAASKDAYYIKVNKKKNTVTVYKKDSKGKYTKPIKAMVCSTGAATPTGTYHTLAKYRWRPLVHNVWGQYCTRITGSILFHSVWYYEKDPSTLSIKEFNRLGTKASAGCVRLSVKDTKWIYDNCGIGTKVTIYNSNNPGPLGKPKAIKIKNYPWDPTDVTNKKNPWNKKKPTIIGAKNKEVLAGGKLDLKSGVKAYDTCGNQITKDLRIDKSKLKLTQAGTYKVTYTVTDAINKKTSKTIKVKVLNPSKVTFKGVKDKVVKYKDYKDKKLKDYVMKGVSATSGKYKIEQKYLSYTSKVIKEDKKEKVYEITYAVKNPTNNKKTKKTVKLTIVK